MFYDNLSRVSYWEIYPKQAGAELCQAQHQLVANNIDDDVAAYYIQDLERLRIQRRIQIIHLKVFIKIRNEMRMNNSCTNMEMIYTFPKAG